MSKETLFDVLINLLLFTPLAVTFIFGNKLIVELVLIKHTSGFGVLAIGVGIEFSITYWQSNIESRMNAYTGSTFKLLSRIHCYIVCFANVCYLLGIKGIYSSAMRQFGIQWSSIQIAVGCLVVLVSLECCRSIVALPLELIYDPPPPNPVFFEIRTVLRTNSTDKIAYFIDCLVTVGVVRALVPLFWITAEDALPGWAPENFIAVGYGSIIAFWMIQGTVQDLSIRCETHGRHLLKKLVEDVYIVGITVSTILAWVGLEEILIKLGYTDVTIGYVFSVGSFVLLCLFGVSQSLAGKGVGYDGVLHGGEGVLVFPGKYFRWVNSIVGEW